MIPGQSLNQFLTGSKSHLHEVPPPQWVPRVPSPEPQTAAPDSTDGSASQKHLKLSCPSHLGVLPGPATCPPSLIANLENPNPVAQFCRAEGWISQERRPEPEHLLPSLGGFPLVPGKCLHLEGFFPKIHSRNQLIKDEPSGFLMLSGLGLLFSVWVSMAIGRTRNKFVLS